MRLVLWINLFVILPGCPGDEGTSPTTATAGEETTTSGTTGSAAAGPATTSTGSTGDESGSTTDSSSTSGASTGAEVPGSCGDGVVDPEEECDDGRLNADDAACTSDCLKAQCGDGLIHEGVEECDNGFENNLESAACTDACKIAVCGDLKVHEGVEECDTEEKSDAYGGCTESCMFGPHCGDKIVQDEEECDDGLEPDPAKCSVDCTVDRAIFVTSVTYTGDLGGSDGADAKCKVLAANAQLPRSETFRAWLSAGGESPAGWVSDQDLTKAYRLPSGLKVADDWTQLTSGLLGAKIDQTETGKTLGMSGFVWTGTKPNGTAGPISCDGWQNGTFVASGGIGLTGETSGAWTDFGELKCHQIARIYCVEVWKAP